MSNLKILEYNQAFMTKIGIYSYQLTNPSNEFFSSFMTYFILLNGTVFTIISSAVFVYKHLSDFQIVLETCLILIAGIQSCGAFLSIGLKMKEMKLLHLKLQAIVDEGIWMTFQFSSLVPVFLESFYFHRTFFILNQSTTMKY